MFSAKCSIYLKMKEEKNYHWPNVQAHVIMDTKSDGKSKRKQMLMPFYIFRQFTLFKGKQVMSMSYS